MSRNFINTSETNIKNDKRNLLGVYNYYRLSIAILLLLTFILGMSITDNKTYSMLFMLMVGYVILSLVFIALFYLLNEVNNYITSIQLLADIIFLIAMEMLFTNQHFVFIIMILMVISATPILVNLKVSLFFSSLTFLALISPDIKILLDKHQINNDNIFYFGILGLCCFSVAILTNYLQRKIILSEENLEKSIEMLRIQEKINEIIVDKVDVAICVIDNENNIINYNSAFVEAAGLNPNKVYFSKNFINLIQKEKANKLNIRQIDVNEYGYDKKVLFITDKDEEIKKIQDIKMISLGRLTASIAHEIRNPLSAIYQAAQILKDEYNTNKLVDIINNNVIRTNNIIDNVLSISKFKQKDFKTYKIINWLNDFLRNYYLEHLDYIYLDYDDSDIGLFLSFDSQSLTQILKNIIDNAIRHCKLNNNKLKRIDIKLQSDNYHRYYLDIVDSGVGVADHSLKNLFEPFYSDGDHDGMGLGLFIARELCQSMNFDLQYIVDGDYKCFRISFFHQD